MGPENTRLAGEKEKSLPLFVRHDRRSGAETQPAAAGDRAPISASTAWDFVRLRAVEAVGAAAAAQIHPHSFRHYFVTVVLLATNNMEKARLLARHKNIATTQLYTEVDRDYHEIFNAPE
jgi:integrase/recombinase XerC